MENTKILKDYFKAKQDLVTAQENVKVMAESLAEYLKGLEGNKAEIPEAKFSLRRDATYKFSSVVEKQVDKIKQLEESIADKVKLNKEILKTLQETEIAEGRAKLVDEKFTPVMTSVKEK